MTTNKDMLNELMGKMVKVMENQEKSIGILESVDNRVTEIETKVEGLDNKMDLVLEAVKNIKVNKAGYNSRRNHNSRVDSVKYNTESIQHKTTCGHALTMTRAKHAQYVKRCRHFMIDTTLCTECAKQLIINTFGCIPSEEELEAYKVAIREQKAEEKKAREEARMAERAIKDMKMAQWKEQYMKEHYNQDVDGNPLETK